MDAQFSFTVDQSTAGILLLEHLPTCIPYLSIEECQSILSKNLILLNDQAITENFLLEANQKITYTIPNYTEGEVDTGWKTLWQNDEIFAVHKPANLPVSRTTRNVYNTLIQLLRRESMAPDSHLLHRLDLETSGIILIGKTKESASKYQPTLPALIKSKIYHAVVSGKPDWDVLEYTCDLNTLKDSAIRCQMHKVEKGKTSKTRFTVLKSNDEFSIIQCELLTGRKHQIRAHLSILGHPIVGDKIYRNNGDFYLKRLEDALTKADHDALLTPHHLLHAYQIIIDPSLESNDEITITDREYSDPWQVFIKQQGLD